MHKRRKREVSKKRPVRERRGKGPSPREKSRVKKRRRKRSPLKKAISDRNLSA